MSRGRATSNGPRGDEAIVAKRNSWVINVPVELRRDEAGLRTTAANLLDLAPVRSVIIDGSRRQAVIRLHANRASGFDQGEIPAVPWSEPATACDSVDATTTSVVS